MKWSVLTMVGFDRIEVFLVYFWYLRLEMIGQEPLETLLGMAPSPFVIFYETRDLIVVVSEAVLKDTKIDLGTSTEPLPTIVGDGSVVEMRLRHRFVALGNGWVHFVNPAVAMKLICLALIATGFN
jgi:hypothetical protein